MTDRAISTDDYRTILRRLCTGPERNFPRGGRDRAVLLKAASLRLAPARRYTEPEVTGQLKDWLREIGTTLRIDPVTLRRHLVDYGYLDRDPAGRVYWVLERTDWDFESAVARVDQAQATA